MKSYASISTGAAAETVPKPRRTRAAHAPHQAFRHELPSAYFSSRHAPARTHFATFRNSEVSLLNFLWSYQNLTSNLQQSWGAEVSKRERDYRKEWCVVVFLHHTRACFTWAPFLWMNEFHQSSWNLYFSLLFSRNVLFSALFSRNLYFGVLFSRNLFCRRNSPQTNPFLLTFLLKSLLSLNFPIEISTFSLLFYWNLHFLFTFLLKSLLSLYFPIEILTFS